MKTIGILCVLLLAVCYFPQQTLGSVMGIDLGSQWVKVALVKPKSFDVVLNDHSGRKTEATLALKDDEILIGKDATNFRTKKPSKVIAWAPTLLGKQMNDTQLISEMEDGTFLSYPIFEHPSRPGVPAVNLDKDTVMAPEDLVAILLKHAKDIAGKSAGKPVKDCVITIPPHWTQFERQALLDAAQIADLKVLALMHTTTAFALHYGTERQFSTDEATYNLFYDMGSYTTTASLIEFKSVVEVDKSARKPKNETWGLLNVLATASLPGTGSREYDRVLAKHLFSVAQKKQPQLPWEENKPRVMAKLLKTAKRVKETLSANTEAHAAVEGLLEDFDFQTRVTRQEFEEMSADLLAQVLTPVKEVLAQSALSLNVVNHFELIGGGVRVPAVHQRLLEYVKENSDKETLDRHLNGDEAAVMGATFYAATLSSSFKVRKFKIKDHHGLPVHTRVTFDNEELDGEPKDTRLFKPNNRFGSRKKLSFDVNGDFSFYINYDGDNLDEDASGTVKRVMSGLTRDHLAEYKFTKVPEATRNVSELTEAPAEDDDLSNYPLIPPKVHISFRLTSDGNVIFEKASADTVVYDFPKPVTPNETETDSEDADEDGEEKEKESKSNDEESKEETEEEKEETEEKKEETEEETPEEPQGPVKRVKTSYLSVNRLFEVGMSASEIRESTTLQKQLLSRADAKKEKEKEQNALESFIYSTRDELGGPEDEEDREEGRWDAVTTAEQRNEIRELLAASEEYLYDEAITASASEIRKKLKELKKPVNEAEGRKLELQYRPTVLNSVREKLGKIMASIKGISTKKEVTEEEEAEFLEKCQQALDNIEELAEKQSAMKPWEEPVLKSLELKDIVDAQEKAAKRLTRRSRKKEKKPAKIEVDPETVNEEGEPEPKVETGDDVEAEIETPENTESENKAEEASHDEI